MIITEATLWDELPVILTYLLPLFSVIPSQSIGLTISVCIFVRRRANRCCL